MILKMIVKMLIVDGMVHGVPKSTVQIIPTIILVRRLKNVCGTRVILVGVLKRVAGIIGMKVLAILMLRE
jgi:hypothetical protein